MKKLLLLSLSLFAAGAQADTINYYAGGGVGIWNFSESGHKDLFNVSSLEVLGGLTFWNWLSVEGRLGAGVEDSTENKALNGASKQIPTKLTLENYATVYIKPELRNEIARLYGLLGYSSASISQEAGGNEVSADISGLSFGAGMGFQLSDAAVINLEYVRLVQDGDYRFAGYNIGFNYQF